MFVPTGYVAAVTVLPDYAVEDLIALEDSIRDLCGLLHVLAAAKASGGVFTEKYVFSIHRHGLALIDRLRELTGTDTIDANDSFAIQLCQETAHA